MGADNGIRLQIYLARCGVGSRRRCETYIEQGHVSVDGKVVTEQGTKVSGNERVTVNGRLVIPESKKRYVAVNKPRGYVCSISDPFGRPTTSSLFSTTYAERLFHVGRLDMESDGLIFYSNDGSFARIVTHPSSCIEKEYLVETPDLIVEHDMRGFLRGVAYRGNRYVIDGYTLLSRKKVVIRLHEGKNREVRELFRSVGYRVSRLTRVRIGIVSLDSIDSCGFRELTGREINWFLKRGGVHGSGD